MCSGWIFFSSDKFRLFNCHFWRIFFLVIPTFDTKKWNICARVEFFSSDTIRLFNYVFLTEFFCYSHFRYKVTEYLCTGWILFLQTNFDFLASIFDGICYYSDFPYKVTEYLCSGWIFFSSDKFRLFNCHFWRIFFLVIPTFDTKVTEYLCSGWILFSSDKFQLFN